MERDEEAGSLRMSALSQGRNNSQELGGKPPSCKGNQSPPPLSCSVYGHREMDFICTFWVAEGGRAVGGTSCPWPRPHGLECLGRENPRSMCWLGVRVIVKRWAMLKFRHGSDFFLLGAGSANTLLEMGSLYSC